MALRLSTRALAGFLTSAAVLGTSSLAFATDPLLRHQEDLHGDVVVFGSTLGFDCGSGVPAPAGAAASCASEVNISDTAPDLYWRDSVADASITPTQARTSATLVLPAGAKVTYARLYWAALDDKPSADLNATLDWLGGPQQTITADDSWVLSYGFASHPDWYYYQASGDATDFVSTWGAGDFRVSDVEAIALAGVTVDRAFSAWSLVVFYEHAGDELRNLALFDGFTPIDPGMPAEQAAQVTLSGFLVPQGFSARMSAICYEGDNQYTGDHFTLNGTQVTNALNPADDFFNSTRSHLGAPVSGAADVPKLSGVPGSMAGYDLDTVDVTPLLAPGDTSAVVGADSALDIFFLGGFVTSVASLGPDYNGFTKTVVDLNGGAVLPGDVLRYTIDGTNQGNDASVDTTITDVIQAGLAFVPGSIEILAGGNLGAKTDAAGDDEGEYDAAQKLVTVRVGPGADALTGGTVQAGDVVTIRFDVKVTASTGTLLNQATLTASGDAGAPQKEWLSDGDYALIGAQPTSVTVSECDSDAQCSGKKPHCDLTTHVCVGCTSDADCKDPANPACEPSGACGQCSGTNQKKCVGATPACDVPNGICTLCTLGPKGDASKCKLDPKGPVCVAGSNMTVHCGCLQDPDCGGPKSGKVCDSVPETCEDGCRGMGGNGCPDGMECTSKDTTIGKCVVTGGGGGGGGGGVGGGTSGSGGAPAGVPQDPGDTGGCGCRVPAEEGGDLGGAMAGALGLLALASRRRRRP